MGAILLFCVAGCQWHGQGAAPAPPLRRYEYAQVHMGVQARLIVYTPDEEIAKRACRAAYDRIADLEQIMSDYRPDSEVMQLTAKPAGEPVKISKELMFVLHNAQTLSAETGGAFDVTVGPLVQLWRAARKSSEMPSAEALADAKTRVGYRHLHLDPEASTATLDRPGMRLDLGGIGKGYAGDEAIAVLKEYGINNALFEAGGDIVVSDAPPGTPGWPIEVYEGEHHPPRKLVLKNAAVSTSGATEQFVTIGGSTYSHVVDPRTGVGLTNQYMATVVAPKGITSDALSTALTIVDPEKRQEVLRHYKGARAYVRKVM